MKYKEIFKMWHFWVVTVLWTIYTGDFFSYSTFFDTIIFSYIPSFLGHLLLTLILYSIAWLIFGRDKKDLLT